MGEITRNGVENIVHKLLNEYTSKEFCNLRHEEQEKYFEEKFDWIEKRLTQISRLIYSLLGILIAKIIIDVVK